MSRGALGTTHEPSLLRGWPWGTCFPSLSLEWERSIYFYTGSSPFQLSGGKYRVEGGTVLRVWSTESHESRSWRPVAFTNPGEVLCGAALGGHREVGVHREGKAKRRPV